MKKLVLRIMKHSQQYMKWFSRCILLVLITSFTVVATKPSYNLAHWIPHGFLRQLGIPYPAVLWGEQNLDKFLHFFGAAALTYLIVKSQIYTINKCRSLYLVMLLCLAAECAQLIIGRGFNSSDLLLGILGSFMAYLGINENKDFCA